MEKEDGSVEQKGAVGGQQKPSTPVTTGGTQPKKTPIKGPKPPIPPRRSSTLDSQSSPDTEKSCEVSDNNDKKIRENETTTTITSPKENNKKSRVSDDKSSAVSRKKIDDAAIKGAETGNGNNIKVDKVELTENLDNKQKVGEDERAAAAIEIKKDDQGHVTSSSTKIEKILETKTTKSNNTIDEDITSNVLLSMLTSTEEKNKIIEKKSDDVVNISSCEEKEILEKKIDKKIRETDTKSDKDIIKSTATSQKIEISKKADEKNMAKKEIFNNSGNTVKVEIEESIAIIKEEEKVELVIKKDEKIKSEKMETDKHKKCSTSEEATTSKEISSEVQHQQQQEIQIKKSLVKKETLIYDETKDILITAKNKKKDEKSSDDEKTVKRIEHTTTDINSKITTNKKNSPNLEEPKVEKSDVMVIKESDPNTTSGGGNRKPEMPPTGSKQTAQTSTRVEEDNKENKIKNQTDDGISSGSGLVVNKKIDQVTTIPTASAVSSTTTKSTPEIPSRKNETSKNVTKVAKMVINDDDKSVTLTNTKVEEKIAETKSVTKIDKSVTNDTSKTSKVDSSVTNTKSTTKNNDKSVTSIYRSTVTNASKSVSNAAKSVTNAAKSATNIEKSVTNVSKSVTNFKNSKVTSPPDVSAEPKPEMNQLKTGSTKQTAENSSNQDIINKSCEVNNTSNGLSVSTILDPEQEADRIFAQFKQRKRLFKRNLIIEGSCNYFFWMDKIAMVSSFFFSLTKTIYKSSRITYFFHADWERIYGLKKYIYIAEYEQEILFSSTLLDGVVS